jgi:hypothetical protein
MFRDQLNAGNFVCPSRGIQALWAHTIRIFISINVTMSYTYINTIIKKEKLK